MYTILLAVGGVLALLAVCTSGGRRAIGRFVTAISAQFGNMGRWAKNVDPLAVYKDAIDAGEESMARAKTFLATIAGDKRNAESEVENAIREVARLNNKLDLAQNAGDPNNTVEGYALDLADAETRQENAKAELARVQGRFDEYTLQFNTAKAQIEQARKEAKELGTELQRSEREKEMDAFAQSFNAGAGLDDLSQARDALKRKINENRGSVDANKALNQQAVREAKDADLERKAKAQEILARRAKKE